MSYVSFVEEDYNQLISKGNNTDLLKIVVKFRYFFSCALALGFK